MKTAWFGELELKQSVMARLREHRRLDQIAQRVYWESDRGCHLGCLTHYSSETHSAAERMFGIPLRVTYWLEAVFEGLPTDQCAWWVIEGTDAIPVGADLSLAHHELAYWLLGPESPSAKGNAHPSVAAQVAAIRALHDRARNGNAVSDEEWSAAQSASRSASQSALWSASRSAAWSAAQSAAWSASWSASRSAAWKRIADQSIEIFRAAPIKPCDDCGPCAQAAMLHVRSHQIVRSGAVEMTA